ncbi:Spy/CpxP family protein refolding chaperone [Fibrella aquatilis]|uniref:Periplasmic heavy metal sensor n=1 Tax=Fibrella aquatilis TaxID=2817059 RepID=A0A939K2T1_9BACT|nr:periplasmic heavy metal sensor [Fibrella aquatilis]MBO0934406.1 periplasmic heavy metal sensor [Fibrella aquatilis]
MERTKLLTVAVVFLLIINFLTVGRWLLQPAGPPPGSGVGRPNGPAELINQRLHFSESQRQQYRLLIDQHQQALRPLNREAARLYGAYYGLLAQTPPDTARAAAFSQQIAQNQRLIAGVNFAHFRQIKALCRPDQQADFTRLVADLAQLFNHTSRGNPPGHERPGQQPDENFAPRP